MTLLPAKRKPARSGIERSPKREWPRHRKWLRSHHCAVRFCKEEPVEVSHIRTAANAGVAIKPHDSSAVPMCHMHHELYNRHGHETFERTFNINLAKLADLFVRTSPDTAMRESLKLASAALCIIIACLICSPAMAQHSYLEESDTCLPGSTVDVFGWCRNYHDAQDYGCIVPGWQGTTPLPQNPLWAYCRGPFWWRPCVTPEGNYGVLDSYRGRLVCDVERK